MWSRNCNLGHLFQVDTILLGYWTTLIVPLAQCETFMAVQITVSLKKTTGKCVFALHLEYHIFPIIVFLWTTSVVYDRDVRKKNDY